MRILSYVLGALAFGSLVIACGGAGGAGATAGGSDGGGSDAATGKSDAAVGPRDNPGTITPKCTGGAQPLDKTWTIASHGGDRSFHVHVPASYDGTKPTPVVMDFHGYRSNGAEEDILGSMSSKGDKEGFITLQADGVGKSWNAGACCGQAAQTQVDDVGFVGDMLDAVEKELCVDVKRIFAAGMSNGGFLSHRLGCELASRVAAIAPVAGVLGLAECKPSRPIPVIHFHGTLDMLVPYMGNASMGFPSVPDTFAGWAKRNGCTDVPTETFRKGDSHCATYAACAGGSAVTLCTVDGGGHTWPGGFPVPSLGYTTMNLSATDAAWEFFKAHPLP